MLPGELVAPGNERRSRIAEVVRGPEFPAPSFIGDIDQRLGIVAQGHIARKRCGLPFHKGSNGLGIDPKLQSVPNKDDPNAEFDIAFLNRAVLERHGYDTATITDSDLQELAGRMGDYYCESSKFSEDLRTACGDFGLKLRDTTNPK